MHTEQNCEIGPNTLHAKLEKVELDLAKPTNGTSPAILCDSEHFCWIAGRELGVRTFFTLVSCIGVCKCIQFVHPL